jgi:molybdopterin-containing oxidoreductase family membrane subunit
MWVSNILAVFSLVLLIVPRFRNSLNILVMACVAVFISLWIDKGLGMVVTGFVPNPFGEVVEYWPTVPEFFITLSIYALGALILTVLYKVVISIREQVAGYH